MKPIVSDINKKRKYYDYPKKKIRVFLYSHTTQKIIVVMLLVGSFFISGVQSITAAPIDSNYYAYSISNTLLAQVSNTQTLKQALESQLQEVMKQIDNYKQQISNIQKQKQGIQQEISLINAKIKKAELEIQAIEIQIGNLQKRISETKRAIEETQAKVEKSRVFLSAAIKYYYQLSRKSAIEVVLAEEQLSDYFKDFVYVQKLQGQINKEIVTLRDLNESLNYQKAKMEDQLAEQSDLLSIAQVKRQELAGLRGERQVVLAQTQNQENTVSSQLQESEKTAAQIRTQLVGLAGGSGPIKFADALRIAQIASNLTGIRPAFLIAILDYESKLGKNVGTCTYLEAMKPTDRSLFEQITRELGFDPLSKRVSCKPWYGWGGAMGPAQFIPSTWMGYRDRVSALTGNKPANPWNITDAFMAAAIKLTDAGAGKQTSQAEWKSAMIYFAGSNWSKPSLSFYGDDVLVIAARYQKDINTLNASGQ